MFGFDTALVADRDLRLRIVSPLVRGPRLVLTEVVGGGGNCHRCGATSTGSLPVFGPSTSTTQSFTSNKLAFRPRFGGEGEGESASDPLKDCTLFNGPGVVSGVMVASSSWGSIGGCKKSMGLSPSNDVGGWTTCGELSGRSMGGCERTLVVPLKWVNEEVWVLWGKSERYSAVSEMGSSRTGPKLVVVRGGSGGGAGR